jgi:antitoxin PrlF
MSTATITSKGQITIPVDIRSGLNLRSGDRINFILDESGKVSFLPITKNVSSLKGIIAAPEVAVSIEDMKSVVKEKGSKL